MKPLLLSAPLTDEDRAAWFDWQVNRRRDWALWGALEALSFPQDRRDAELICWAQRIRYAHRDMLEAHSGLGLPTLESETVEMGGAPLW